MALGFVLAFSPGAPAVAQSTAGDFSQADSARAHGYLDIVLDLIQARSINRDSVDWQAIRPAAHARVGAGGSTAAAYPAIRWVLAQLRDHHSRLLTADEVAALQDGRSAGFGLRVLFPEGMVAQVYGGGPADRAGVRVGDVVTAVNGARPSADPNGVLVTFPRQDTVRLALRRAGDPIPDVTLAAGPVEMNRPPAARRLRGGIGYLEIPEYVGFRTVGDFASYAAAGQAALRRVDTPGVCGWIVDLRANGGGNMWPMLAAAGPLLGDGVLGAFVSPGSSHPWGYVRGRALLDGRVASEAVDSYVVRRANPPVAVLTSRITASSGEAVTIAFRGRPRTRSFGEATRGLPTANTTLPLDDGALLLLTTAADADRTGRTYRARIEPDVQVRMDWRDIGGDGDAVIAAASAWLRAQPECGGGDLAH